MTTTVPNAGRSSLIGHRSIVVDEGVYRPQHDSQLLIDQLEQIAVAGRTVVDLCTGSGVVAVAAARLGAAAVTAWDICPARGALRPA